VELFVPVHLQQAPPPRGGKSRNLEYADFFLRTFLLFWPNHANTMLRIVLDEEVQNTSALSAFEASVAQRLASKNHHDPADTTKLNYSFIAQSPWYNNQGYYRQQYAMFWADNYTDAEFIAFADSDTTLVTYVDREDLFEDGKPVINGRFGAETMAPWRNVPGTTLAITGKEEPMRCMSYFPVVIRRSHLALIRRHIVSHLKARTFDEAFQTFSGYYSQFNIMCTVLFWDEQLRNQYSWYVHDYTPRWDGTKNPKPNIGQWTDRSIFTREMFLPKPRVAVHARWHNHWERNALTIYTHPPMFTEFLQRGLCDSPPLGGANLFAFCSRWQSLGRVSFNSTVVPNERFTGYNREMHSFEFVDYYEEANQTDIFRLHRERLDRISSCPPIHRQSVEPL